MEFKSRNCQLFLRCDGEDSGSSDCDCEDDTCTLKKKRVPDFTNELYSVKSCVADRVSTSSSSPCTPVNVSDLRYTEQSAGDSCEDTEGQKGSVTYVDLILPNDKVLFVEVETKVPGQTSRDGFFVRPTHVTRNWGKAFFNGETTASFYLANTGQFSVEFASDAIWRDQDEATNFDALMIFVNPPITLPSNLIPISPPLNDYDYDYANDDIFSDLGPNKSYLFVAGINYDWGKDRVFKVHDNTEVYFEKGAHVRGRIVQTEKKVDNVVIKGYGTLDVHYDLEDDLIGISDDATRQNIGIYGKNIDVEGVTLINTNPTCR